MRFESRANPVLAVMGILARCNGLIGISVFTSIEAPNPMLADRSRKPDVVKSPQFKGLGTRLAGVYLGLKLEWESV